MKKTIYTLLLLMLTTMANANDGVKAQDYMLYGHLVSSSMQSMEAGIYGFSTERNDDLKPLSLLQAEPNCGAVKADGRYFVFNTHSTAYGKESAMFIYDASDGFKIITKAMVPADFIVEEQVLAYDPITKLIYTFYTNGGDNCLGCLDVSTRTKRKIANMDYTKFVSMAFNGKGQLYGISNIGALYEIDKEKGTTKYIGSTGVSPAEYQQCATFLPNDDGALYWAAATGTAGALYKIDTNNAKATLVKTFPHEEKFVSVWPGDKIVLQDAPAKAERVNVNFVGGALEGVVTFQAPTTTHAGKVLTGKVEYKVLVDNVEKGTGSAQPGSTVKTTVKTTQGYHDFCVVMSNDVGEGEKTRAQKIYIGNDTPCPVENVTLKRGSAENALILTWQPQAKGLHGGYVNPASVKYKIRRMPDGKIVSTQATSPFTDTYDIDKPARCFYDVIPWVDEATEGVASSSNKLLAGKPFTIPYREDFSKNSNFLLFTTENVGNDNLSWDYISDYGYLRIYGSDAPKDDWVISPFIKVEKGCKYKLKFDVMSIGKERYEVKLGKEDNSKSMRQQLVPETEIESDYEWKAKECVFTCDEGGMIFIGFHAMTTDTENSQALYLDNISVEKIEESPVTQSEIVMTTKAEKGDRITLSIENDGDVQVEGAELKYGGVAVVKSPTITIRGKIKRLDCSQAQLSKLDVSKARELTSLWCSENELTDLDVSNLPDLNCLYCSKNNLTALNIDANKRITELDCSENKIAGINLSNNKELNRFLAFHNKLSRINLENNEKLIGIDLSENSLTQLDVTNNRLLETIYCNGNQIHGDAMVKFINSLPNRNDRQEKCHLFVIDTKNGNERNEIADTQVKHARSVNWEIFDYAGGDNDANGIVYDGKTDGITGNTIDDRRHDIYSLQGQRIRSKAAGVGSLPHGVYIMNGKKVVVR